MRYTVRTVTPPQQLPVTLAEARAWARIDADITDQDSVLVLLIGAMSEYAESLTGRAFVQRTMELVMDEFPSDDPVIELPYPPLVSVESITYTDGDGAQQVLSGSPSQFQVDTRSEPGRVAALYGSSWPAIRSDLSAVRIRYVAGYPTMSEIPRTLKLWIEARMVTLYENREQIIVGNIVNSIPRDFVDGVLDGIMVRTGFA